MPPGVPQPRPQGSAQLISIPSRCQARADPTEHPAALAAANAPRSEPAPSSTPLLAGLAPHFQAASSPQPPLASAPAAAPGSLPCGPRLPPRPRPAGQRVPWPRGCSALLDATRGARVPGWARGVSGGVGAAVITAGAVPGPREQTGAGERDEPSPAVLGSPVPSQRHGVRQPPAPPPHPLRPLGAGRAPASRHGPVVLPPGLGGHHAGAGHQPHGPHGRWGRR